MDFMKHLTAILSALWLCTLTTSAQEVGDSRLSFGGSSYGATAEYAYRFHSNLSVRGVAGGLITISETFDVAGETYAGDIAPGALGLMLDWHTGLGGLRVSGGVVYSAGEATGRSDFTGTFDFGGVTFSGTDTVNVSIKARDEVAPAISVGYDHHFNDRFVLSAEVGGVLNGGYSVTATSSPGGAIEIFDPTVLTTEAAEIEREINDTLDFYPYVSIMLGIRF
jgi:hypothetical protein